MCEICEQKFEPSLKGQNYWYERGSIVLEKKGKCLIYIHRNFYYDKELDLDQSLGLIGMLLQSNIMPKGVVKEKEHLVFHYSKSHAKKIRTIEKDYFSGKIQVDAQQMAIGLLLVVNQLLQEVVTVYKR